MPGRVRSSAYAVPLVIGLLFAGCAVESERRSEGGLDAVSLRLPIPVVDAAFAPYYLAQDRGIFASHGLEVKLEPGSPELNPVRMIDSGIDEFGVVGGPELVMSGRAAGAQIKGIALLHRDANFPIIISLAESGIRTPQDLNGKSIGFFIGHISTDVLRAFLQDQGVDYREVDVGFNYGPLLAGQIDASWAFSTTAGITLPAQGVELNVIDPADYGMQTQGHVVITHERLIEDRPELVQRFVDALVEALDYGLRHPDEAVAATVSRDLNLGRDVAEKQLDIYNAAIRRNEYLGALDSGRLERVAERQRRMGVLPNSYRIEGSFDPRFVEGARDRMGGVAVDSATAPLDASSDSASDVAGG